MISYVCYDTGQHLTVGKKKINSKVTAEPQHEKPERKKQSPMRRDGLHFLQWVKRVFLFLKDPANLSWRII